MVFIRGNKFLRALFLHLIAGNRQLAEFAKEKGLVASQWEHALTWASPNAEVLTFAGANALAAPPFYAAHQELVEKL